MDFIFSIKNHYFEKGTPWIELDKIKQRSWFLSVDIEDDEVVPCYDTEHELRISKGIVFKSVKILTGKTQETHPYWEALLDMSYLNSTELRDITFKDLPDESGIYMLNIWFDYDDEELSFGDDFKKLCEYRHIWPEVQAENVTLRAHVARLKDALREIRDYDSYKHPDESIIALHEATIKESNECTACQHAKQAKWPPSGLCNKHYSLVTRAHDRVSQMFSYKQTWEPREIARRALESR